VSIQTIANAFSSRRAASLKPFKGSMPCPLRVSSLRSVTVCGVHRREEVVPALVRRAAEGLFSLSGRIVSPIEARPCLHSVSSA